ncbi:MAG: hypothetical protein QXW70_03485 [Candidatus Anstonellales archaeon]
MKKIEGVLKQPLSLPGIPEVVLFIIILVAMLITISAYFPIAKKDEISFRIGDYIILNTTYKYNNLFPQNSIEVFKGARLFYFYFPPNSIQYNTRPLYLLSDASFIRDNIGILQEGEPLEIYPMACSKIEEGYVPVNYFNTKSVLEVKEKQIVCVKSLFGRQKQIEFGVASVSENAIRLQVLSVRYADYSR